MTMKWRKLGRMFECRQDAPWMTSHAAVPFADHIAGDRYRIYFSSRDADRRSHTGYVVVDLNRPQQVLELSRVPVLSPGALGTFDDSGAMGSCILNVGGRKYLYYIGWNLGVTVPFRNAIGLAVSDDGGATFGRYADGPIIDRTCREPHFAASSCVLADDGRYRMWYLSCVKWTLVAGMPRHHYHIKYAESQDGISWKRDGLVAIDFKDSREYAISVPRVIREKNVYRMWYSCRGDRYRIGYAESRNGSVWTRKDEDAGIEPSAAGWDSEMICYPFVFDHKGVRYLLYNGNGYGETGFGIAVME